MTTNRIKNINRYFIFKKKTNENRHILDITKTDTITLPYYTDYENGFNCYFLSPVHRW